MPRGVNNLVLYSPAGVFIETLSDFIKIECVLSEMNIGTLEVTMPPTHNDAIYQRDARLAYYRAPTSESTLITPALVGNCTWLIQRVRREVTADGLQTLIITAVHPNHLLSRRVIAYNDESAGAQKDGVADDVMKAYVRENFTLATDVTRDWAATLFAVEADAGLTTTIHKAASYRTVLTTLQEISQDAQKAGFYAGFEVYSPTETGPYTFRTYYPQRGADHSALSSTPIVLGVAYGSLSDTELDLDWTNMASFVYAGGTGKQDERQVVTASDDIFIAGSPFGRIEWFANAAHTDVSGVYAGAAAGAMLWARRPRRLFTGTVVSTPAATFGEEYDWGDRVVGEFSAPIVWQGYSSGQIVYQFDCRVDPVKITVERVENEETNETEETETLDIRLRGFDVGVG
jgi:hypothetical protein